MNWWNCNSLWETNDFITARISPELNDTESKCNAIRNDGTTRQTHQMIDLAGALKRDNNICVAMRLNIDTMAKLRKRGGTLSAQSVINNYYILYENKSKYAQRTPNVCDCLCMPRMLGDWKSPIFPIEHCQCKLTNWPQSLLVRFTLRNSPF